MLVVDENNADRLLKYHRVTLLQAIESQRFRGALLCGMSSVHHYVHH